MKEEWNVRSDSVRTICLHRYGPCPGSSAPQCGPWWKRQALIEVIRLEEAAHRSVSGVNGNSRRGNRTRGGASAPDKSKTVTECRFGLVPEFPFPTIETSHASSTNGIPSFPDLARQAETPGRWWCLCPVERLEFVTREFDFAHGYSSLRSGGQSALPQPFGLRTGYLTTRTELAATPTRSCRVASMSRRRRRG